MTQWMMILLKIRRMLNLLERRSMIPQTLLFHRDRLPRRRQKVYGALKEELKNKFCLNKRLLKHLRIVRNQR